MYMCIIHKNCNANLKKSVWNFCFLKLFCPLVRNENTKRPKYVDLGIQFDQYQYQNNEKL